MYYDAAYAPFGQPYAEGGTTDHNFTGMDQNIVSGLYDFPSREYNDLAKAAGPRPIPPALTPRNSPLMMVDPDGTDGLNYYDCLIRDCGAFSNLFNGGLYGPLVGYGGMTDLDVVNWINQQDNQTNPAGMYTQRKR